MFDKITQLTEAEAKALHDRGDWKNWDDNLRASFQLNQSRLCMPFDVFQQALEVALGRPVWTHELCNPAELRAELENRKAQPTMAEIINLLPADKTVLIQS
jgi:hypothetical protein